jgi:hypothetical protein
MLQRCAPAGRAAAGGRMGGERSEAGLACGAAKGRVARGGAARDRWVRRAAKQQCAAQCRETVPRERRRRRCVSEAADAGKGQAGAVEQGREKDGRAAHQQRRSLSAGRARTAPRAAAAARCAVRGAP